MIEVVLHLGACCLPLCILYFQCILVFVCHCSLLKILVIHAIGRD